MLNDVVPFHCRLISSFHGGTKFFRQFWPKFLSDKVWHVLFVTDINIWTCACQIKQLTSHFDVTFDLSSLNTKLQLFLHISGH